MSGQAINRKEGKYTVAKGIGLGVIAGIVGMIVMDLVMIVEFLIMGLPVYTYLDLIGSVMGGGVLLGVILHLLLGSVLGVIFVIAVLKVHALNIRTVRKGVALGFLAGAVTIVGCVPFALIIVVPIVTIISFSTVPHLVWGSVTGAIVGYKLRSNVY